MLRMQDLAEFYGEGFRMKKAIFMVMVICSLLITLVDLSSEEEEFNYSPINRYANAMTMDDILCDFSTLIHEIKMNSEDEEMVRNISSRALFLIKIAKGIDYSGNS